MLVAHEVLRGAPWYSEHRIATNLLLHHVSQWKIRLWAILSISGYSLVPYGLVKCKLSRH